MVCYNHLRMIGHAALMYRTQTGKAAASLAELAEADCAPGEFGKGKFACPEHGEYTLAADGLTGVCSHHGYASYLTPCCEIETTHVTEAEADGVPAVPRRSTTSTGGSSSIRSPSACRSRPSGTGPRRSCCR